MVFGRPGVLTLSAPGGVQRRICWRAPRWSSSPTGSPAQVPPPTTLSVPFQCAISALPHPVRSWADGGSLQSAPRRLRPASTLNGPSHLTPSHTALITPDAPRRQDVHSLRQRRCQVSVSLSTRQIWTAIQHDGPDHLWLWLIRNDKSWYYLNNVTEDGGAQQQKDPSIPYGSEERRGEGRGGRMLSLTVTCPSR